MQGLWMLVLVGAALLVRLGMMLSAVGAARAKNAASAGGRSLADLCVVTLCFWAVGFAIVTQTSNPIFGVELRNLVGWSGLSPNWLQMLLLALIASGIAAAAVAERSTFAVPVALGGLLGGVIVPMTAHWTFRGWLNEREFIDAAGAASAHLTGALCAMSAALVVGPRQGKYNRDGSSNMIPGHSVPLTLIATMIMLIGWLPYVMALSRAELRLIVPPNVLISAAAAGFVSLVIGRIRFGKVDLLLMSTGILGGLVSVTAAAPYITTLWAFVIGVVAGIVIPWMTVQIDLRWKIDDPGGVIAIHGVGAVWALLAAGIFSPGAVKDRLMQLAVQALGMLVIGITTIALALLALLLVRLVVGLRAKEADEHDGLDLAEHDINAHPDFQQTMIKSYHLREA